MTILDALKGLYAKLGGKKSPDNIQTIGEALEDITTVAVNGSDALPAVTAEDVKQIPKEEIHRMVRIDTIENPCGE